MLTKEASTALLKTLEEPPDHVIFVLATTDPQMVLPTIRSRTQHFEFSLLPADRLAAHLADVAGREGVEADPDALATIARRAGGSARDALSLLDQALAYGDGPAPPGADRRPVRGHGAHRPGRPSSTPWPAATSPGCWSGSTPSSAPGSTPAPWPTTSSATSGRCSSSCRLPGRVRLETPEEERAAARRPGRGARAGGRRPGPGDAGGGGHRDPPGARSPARPRGDPRPPGPARRDQPGSPGRACRPSGAGPRHALRGGRRSTSGCTGAAPASGALARAGRRAPAAEARPAACAGPRRRPSGRSQERPGPGAPGVHPPPQPRRSRRRSRSRRLPVGRGRSLSTMSPPPGSRRWRASSPS